MIFAFINHMVAKRKVYLLILWLFLEEFIGLSFSARKIAEGGVNIGLTCLLSNLH